MSGNVEILINAQDNASGVIDGVAKNVGGFSTSLAALGPIGAVVGVALAAVATAFLAVSSAIDAVSESAGKIDELTDTAAGLGESVTDLQAFQFAMEEAGNVDSDKSIQALQRIQKLVGEVASGSGGGAADVFKQLGLDASQLSMQGPVDQFMALKQGIAGIENISERAATAQKLLGKSAADLIPALISEQAEFEASMNAAHEFGLTVSESGAAGVAAMNDELGRISAAFEGVTNQVAVELAPAVELVASQITAWLPPAIDFAKTYLPAAVETTVVLVGYTADLAAAFYKITTLDFVGAVAELTDEVSNADRMLQALYDARNRAAQEALDNAVQQQAVAAATAIVDEEALRQQEAKAAAAAKTVEQLERELLVAQLGADAVKQQEQLATATNDAERERIQLLQEQIAQQEALNQSVIDQAKAEQDAAAARQKEIEDKAKEEQSKAEALAKAQPGTQAVESRLLTRGAADRGIDKVAKNTEKTVTKLDEVIAALTNGKSGPDIQFEMVN